MSSILTPQKAIELFRRIVPVADQAGFGLAIYGSALWKDGADDMDLVAFPTIENMSAFKLVEAFLLAGMERVGEMYSNNLGTRQRFKFDGTILDVSIRR